MGLNDDIFKGEGKILIIDDEEIVRMASTAMLEECGYEVITAESGDEGIRIFQQFKDNLKLVILDLAMPGKTGKETFIELKNIESGVKVLLASGYEQDEQVHEMFSLGINGFLQKPFSLINLSRKVSETIG
ncbi:MAG: response regulator [Acidobacteriota bacterium]